MAALKKSDHDRGKHAEGLSLNENSMKLPDLEGLYLCHSI